MNRVHNPDLVRFYPSIIRVLVEADGPLAFRTILERGFGSRARDDEFNRYYEATRQLTDAGVVRRFISLDSSGQPNDLLFCYELCPLHRLAAI
jgi:hypothetical protein